MRRSLLEGRWLDCERLGGDDEEPLKLPIVMGVVAAGLAARCLSAAHFKNRFIQKEHCYSCHTDYGVFGTMEAKLNGMGHVYKDRCQRKVGQADHLPNLKDQVRKEQERKTSIVEQELGRN